MPCGGCAQRRAERAALREQRLQEKEQRRLQAEQAQKQAAITAAAQK